MSKVYIVSARGYKKAYYAEPVSTEKILKVFDDYHKAIVYICDCIREDHKIVDNPNRTSTFWTKYEPKSDNFEEGMFIRSVAFDDNSSYEDRSYRFRVYDVE